MQVGYPNNRKNTSYLQNTLPQGTPKPLLNLNEIIPWPRDNFSIDGEPETQKVSALIQHGNGISSRKNLGQNIFAKRGKESTRIIKITTSIHILMIPHFNDKDIPLSYYLDVMASGFDCKEVLCASLG